MGVCVSVRATYAAGRRKKNIIKIVEKPSLRILFIYHVCTHAHTLTHPLLLDPPPASLSVSQGTFPKHFFHVKAFIKCQARVR